MTGGVYEGAGMASFLFCVLCFEAGMTPVADVFPWEVTASNRIFFSFGEKKSDYLGDYLGVAFGEAMLNGNTLFGFV